MAESGGAKRVNLQCVGIVFKKFIDVVQFSQIVTVLKDHDAISTSQCKKLREAIQNQNYGNVVDKIIEYVENKKCENFEKALQDKDFPCNGETRKLLLTIFNQQVTYLHLILRMLQNLDTLVRIQTDLSNILGVAKSEEEKDESCKVKKLIIHAMKKLEHGEKEEIKAVETAVEHMVQEKIQFQNLEASENHDSERLKKTETNNEKEGDSDSGNLQATEVDDNTNAITSDGHSETGGKDKDGTFESPDQTDNNSSSKNQTTLNAGATEFRPTTRSQTSGREYISHDSNTENQSQRMLRLNLRPADGGIMNRGNDSRFLEFRAVLSESNPLPPSTSLHIIMEGLYDWKPLPMVYNESKRCFIYQCVCSTDYNESLRYKFCFLVGDSPEPIHEKLPHDHYDYYVNRQIDMAEVTTSWIVILSVCLFDRNYSWTERCCETMKNLLPPFGLTRSEVDQTSAAVDIFLWINCVKHGWQTDEKWISDHKPTNDHFEQVLVKWLLTMKEKMSNNIKDIMVQTTATLALIVSLAYEQHVILHSKLLILLFQMLRIDKLETAEECNNLYLHVMKEYKTVENLELKLPTFREAIEWLYKQIPNKPNLDWMLTLPLYWLMVHGGEIKQEVQKPKANKNFLYPRASLPRMAEFDWNRVFENCRGHVAQRPELINQSSTFVKMAKLYPWIINTFQFMLTDREFRSLILNREENDIAEYFLVDSALYQYLEGCAKNRFSLFPCAERESCEKYFCAQIDKAMNSAAESNILLAKSQSQFATCINMLTFTNKFLGQNPENIKNDHVQWCLDIVVVKALTWINILDMNEDDLKTLDNPMSKMITLVTKGIHKKPVNRDQVEYWGKLLAVEWHIKSVAAKWKEQIIYQISVSIDSQWLLNSSSKEINGERLLDFYFNDLEDVTLQADVEKCFHEKAYKCAEELLKNTGPGSKFGRAVQWVKRKTGLTPSSPRLIKIFEKIFMKEYEKVVAKANSDAMTAITFLMEWSFSAQFHEVFSADEFASFASNTRKNIENFSKRFKEVVQTLHSKTILVEHLEIILRDKEKFLNLCSILMPPQKQVLPVDVIVKTCTSWSTLLCQWFRFVMNIQDSLLCLSSNELSA